MEEAPPLLIRAAVDWRAAPLGPEHGTPAFDSVTQRPDVAKRKHSCHRPDFAAGR